MAEFTEQWLWPTSEWGVDKFISKVWLPRLRRIEEERAELSEEEQAQVRCIGVKIQFDDMDSLDNTEDNRERHSEDDSGEDDTYYSLVEQIKGQHAENVEIEDEDEDLQEIRAFFTDVEAAEILKEAARVNGLEDYDVWFKMIGKPDPRQKRECEGNLPNVC